MMILPEPDSFLNVDALLGWEGKPLSYGQNVEPNESKRIT